MKRVLPIAGGVALVGLIAAAYLNTTGKPELNVDLDRLMISEVSKVNFQEFIPINGVVLPIQTPYAGIDYKSLLKSIQKAFHY